MKNEVVHSHGGPFVVSHKLLPQPNFVMDEDLLVQTNEVQEEEEKIQVDSSPIDIENYTEEDDVLFSQNLKEAK